MTSPSVEQLTFEQALAELEDLVAQLESGDLELEKALKLYERGVELSRQCTKLLDAAERKIEIVRRASEDEVTVEIAEEGTLFAVPGKEDDQ